MPVRLWCVQGSLKGKQVILVAGKARKIRVGSASDAPLLVFRFAQLDAAGQWRVSSESELLINQKPCHASILHDGDQIVAGTNVFVFEQPEASALEEGSDGEAVRARSAVVEGAVTSATSATAALPAAESDEESAAQDDEEAQSQRQRRRISASHKAVLQEIDTNKRGILERVGKAFKRRDERGEKLEALQHQRQQVLLRAGRFTLGHQGGLGLPPESLVRLFRGEAIELSFEVLHKNHIDHFRSLRDRLLFLDTEIDACRIEMGLAAENHNALEELRLRSDTETEEENAYLAMDAVATQESEFDISTGSEYESYDDDIPDPGKGVTVRLSSMQRSFAEERIKEERLIESGVDEDPTDVVSRPAPAAPAAPATTKKPDAGRRRSSTDGNNGGADADTDTGSEESEQGARRRSTGAQNGPRRRRRTH